MNKKAKIPFLKFPPYGIINKSLLKEVGSENLPGSPTEPIVPPDFQMPAGNNGQRERDWIKLCDDLVTEMADVLWPVWDQKSQSWKGRAVDTMLEMTRVDMEILLHLRAGPGPLQLDARPDSPVRALNCPAHSAFFVEEDQGKIFASYASYDRNLDPKFPAIFSDVFFVGLDAKCSSTDLQLKEHFQRPRPFQMAFLMGKTNFTLEKATSSMTPSMVSGHSLQGLIGVGAVMEQILQSGVPFEPDSNSWKALSQFAVDIGDRRVMGGIHYPSDNLSSWMVLMGLANLIYRSREIKKRLWCAIQQQSLVYRLIVKSNAKVYAAPLKFLRHLAESE